MRRPAYCPWRSGTRFLDEHCPEEDTRKEVEELLGDTLDETGDFEQIANDAIRSPLSQLRREREDSIQPAMGGIPFDDPEKADACVWLSSTKFWDDLEI